MLNLLASFPPSSVLFPHYPSLSVQKVNLSHSSSLRDCDRLRNPIGLIKWWQYNYSNGIGTINLLLPEWDKWADLGHQHWGDNFNLCTDSVKESNESFLFFFWLFSINIWLTYVHSWTVKMKLVYLKETRSIYLINNYSQCYDIYDPSVLCKQLKTFSRSEDYGS